MSLKKWWQALSDRSQDTIEQIGHVGLGILLGLVLGPLSALAVWVREFTTWKLGWPMAGQWGPGRLFVTDTMFGDGEKFAAERITLAIPTAVYPADRVEDLRRDLLWSLVGTAIGSAGQTALIVVWVVL